MSSVRVREISGSDHAAISALCGRELSREREAGQVLAVLLRRPVIGLVAERGSRLAGACISSVGAPAGEQAGGGSAGRPGRLAGYLDLLVVDRAEQRRGVGRVLAAAAERALAARGCGRVQLGGHSPWYAWPGIDLGYTAAVCFAEDLGYRRGSCEVDMTVDLATAPLDTRAGEDRLRAAGVLVRRAGPADDGPLQDALRGSWPETWVTETAAALRSDQGGVHIAVQGRQYAGFCAYGVSRQHEIGPIGTDPRLRSLGIGAVLLRRCLAEQRDRGLASADIGWAGPLSFFSRTVHASISRAFWCYDKEIS